MVARWNTRSWFPTILSPVVEYAIIFHPHVSAINRARAVGGYLLCADDEPGPEVYGGAKDKDQARIVFGQLVAMIEKSRLRPFVRIYRDAIEVPSGKCWAVRRLSTS